MRINEDFLDDVKQDDIVGKETGTKKVSGDFQHSIKIEVLKMDNFIKKASEKMMPNRKQLLLYLKSFLDKNPMFSGYLIEFYSEKSKNSVTVSDNDNILNILNLIDREEDGPFTFIIQSDFKKVSFLSFEHSFVRLVRIINILFSPNSSLQDVKPRDCKYAAIRHIKYDDNLVYSETYNDDVFHLEDWINPINCLKQFVSIYQTLFNIDSNVRVVKASDIDTLFEEWDIEFPEDIDIAKNMFLTEDTFKLPSDFRIYDCTHGDLWTTGSTRLKIEGCPGNPMVKMSEVCKLLRNRKDPQKTYMIQFMPELEGCIVYDELEEYSDYNIMPYIKWERTKNVTVVFDDISLKPEQIEGILDWGKKNAATSIIFSRFMGWMTSYVDIRVPSGFKVQPKRNMFLKYFNICLVVNQLTNSKYYNTFQVYKK